MATHLHTQFDTLMAELLPEEARKEKRGVTHEVGTPCQGTRACGFNDPAPGACCKHPAIRIITDGPYVHFPQDMRRCFFGDYADTNEAEVTLRKYQEVKDVVRIRPGKQRCWGRAGSPVAEASLTASSVSCKQADTSA